MVDDHATEAAIALDDASTTRRIERSIAAGFAWQTGVSALESIAIGLAAGSAVLAAIHLSGDDARSAPALCAAALAFAAGGGSWWIEHRASRQDFARRFDAAEGFAGALRTALEPRAGRVVLALRARVASRVSIARALRSVRPTSMLVFAAPLLGGALYSSAREIEIDSSVTRFAAPSGAIAASARALSAAADDAVREGQVSARDARSIEALAQRAESLSNELATNANDRPELLARAHDVQQRLAEARARPASPSAGSTGLDRALANLDQALATLAPELASSSSPQSSTAKREIGDGSGRLDPTARSGAETSATGDSSSVDRGNAVAGGGGDGRMSPPSNPSTETTTAEAGSPAAPAGPEAGLLGARWWSTRYDDVVARWVDSTRARASNSPSSDSNQSAGPRRPH